MLLVESFAKTKQTAGVQMTTNRLQELRKKRHVKVADISEYLNISQSYYYDLEKGYKRMNEDVLILLSDFYKVSIDYILCRDNIVNNSELDELKPYIDAILTDKDRVLKPDDIKKLIKVAIQIKQIS